ncbi:MAG: hypothetical protein JWN88_1236 [Frankiales bacterium]|jgi:hypothetical protein|nr:hypothetical protein [Frankiales bacterium]
MTVRTARGSAVRSRDGVRREPVRLHVGDAPDDDDAALAGSSGVPGP